MEKHSRTFLLSDMSEQQLSCIRGGSNSTSKEKKDEYIEITIGDKKIKIRISGVGPLIVIE
ncbi:MAG: hypothetical protein WCX48_05070 [Bacteroidales bacterium]